MKMLGAPAFRQVLVTAKSLREMAITWVQACTAGGVGGVGAGDGGAGGGA